MQKIDRNGRDGECQTRSSTCEHQAQDAGDEMNQRGASVLKEQAPRQVQKSECDSV